MSEENDNPEEETAEAESSEPRCGELLAEARRDQQISVLEVAKELHLDEHKVRALERNEFEVLGAPVFAKGHLRKYSQLVGVDESDVFADYYAMTRADGMPPIVSRRKKIRHEMSPGPWLAVAAALLVGAAAYWWFVARVENTVVTTPPPTDPVLPEPAQDEGVDTTTESVPAEELPAEELPAEEPDVTAEPVEQVDDVVDVPSDQLRVSLSFSGDCWTEVSDADGRQLFFSMGKEGQNVELNGKAPITALFGNADNVSVIVNDNPYNLPAPNAADRTVRVAILSQ